MRTQFRNTLMELGASDNRIALILGDISVYLFDEFRQKYPHRFFNMGICESTLISVAAGMSACGFIPFIHSIAPFVTERALEHIKLNLSYNKFGANILSCGASFDYAWDGPTHYSYTDLEILRLIPEMEVMQPGSRKEADALIKSQYANGKASYFRLSDHSHKFDFPVEFGRGVILRDSHSDTTVVTAGPILSNVMNACENLDVNVVYFHTIKPIDHELILRFKNTRFIVIHDAFGLFEAISSCEPGLWLSSLGLPDEFHVCYGNLDQMRKHIGFDSESIKYSVQKLMKVKQPA